MKRILLFGLTGALLVAHGVANAADALICCGGGEVFIISSEREKILPEDRLWRWQAADAAEIPEQHRAAFRTTDDCKPAGESILITSSSGGVALVRRKDKRCLFFAIAKNAHSACLLPQGRIAVASSFGGDELLVFDGSQIAAEQTPLARMPLKGAHGAHWDGQRRRLWALGSDELCLLELRGDNSGLALSVERRWPLPTPGGHDLSPAQDARFLFITTDTRAYRFDMGGGKFEPLAALADLPKVKSVDQHPTTGQLVYQQADAAEKSWWSDRVQLLAPNRTIQIPGERLYKIRWDVPRPLPAAKP